MEERGGKKSKAEQAKRRREEVKKVKLERGRAYMQAVQCIIEINGLTTKEKADRCIGRESVKEWQERIELIQYDVMAVMLKDWNEIEKRS